MDLLLSQNCINFFSGGIGGFVAGSVVAIPEYTKVLFQCSDEKFPQILRGQQKNLLASILPFSSIFACVCAVEFSVNKQIGESHGEVAGILSSAMTGSFFLTYADHLMLHKHKGNTYLQSYNKLKSYNVNSKWCGFTPMVGREAIFITSVLHLGPWLGNRLNNDSSKNQLLWNSCGRLITGILTTLISQPFDSLARQMQKMNYKNPQEKVTMLRALREIQYEYKKMEKNNNPLKHPLLRGALPRIALATCGGIIAGGCFEFFQSKFQRIKIM
jgi:hypothetical protein